MVSTWAGISTCRPRRSVMVRVPELPSVPAVVSADWLPQAARLRVRISDKKRQISFFMGGFLSSREKNAVFLPFSCYWVL